MRGITIAVLVFIVGAIVTLVLERIVKDAPEWIWRAMYGAVIIGPVAITLLSDPCYGYLGSFRQHILASTLIVAIASGIILGTIWIFGIIGFPSSSVYLLARAPVENKDEKQATALPITPENVDSHITQWLGLFRSGTWERDPEDKDVFFFYRILWNDKIKVSVMREKGDRDQFLTFGGTAGLDGKSQAAFDKLTHRQKSDLFRDLALELTKTKLSPTLKEPPFYSEVTKLIRINDTELTTMSFANALEEVHLGMSLILQTTRQRVEETIAAQTKPPPTPGKKASPH